MNVTSPFFGVVIPVYNKAPHIKRAIRSVLEQTFQSFELLVIDDASTDDSLDVIRQFTDARIRVFQRHEPGPGGYAARNLGLREAKAEWVTFLDADDEWYPIQLETLRSLTEMEHRGVIATGWVDSWPDGRIDETAFVKRYAHRDLCSLSFAEFVDECNAGRSVVHTNVVAIHKSVFDSFGGFPDRRCKRGGDIATWLKWIHGSGRIVVKPIAGACYHREDSTVTRTVEPQVNGNCVHMMVTSLLKVHDQRWSQNNLKKFSNLHVNYGLVRRASKGQLRFSDCRYHYASAALLQHAFFRIVALLPSSLQQTLWRFYRMAK